MPVCKKCHNYVMAKEIDKNNPCPHCGNTQSLTDRTEKDFQPVIPKDLQYNFGRGGEEDNNVFIPKTPEEIYGNNYSQIPLPGTVPKRVSQNIPLKSIIPTVEGVSLDPASLNVYFQLSIEFQIILDRAPNYREGVYRWNLLLPERLQAYGLTQEAWEKISALGDSDEKIQEYLSLLIKRIFS